MAYPYNYPQAFQPNYFPVGYQPVQPNFQQANMQQAQPQMQQPTFNPAINQSGIIWISGLQEAQMYPCGPNSAVQLWEKDGKTVYLKSADATGRPSLKIYDLVERTETPQESSGGTDNKVPDFATKEELSAVVGVVKGYSNALEAIKSDLETMRSDLYGVAGRKRIVKKQEAVEDE